MGRLDMPPNQLSQIEGVHVKIDGVTVFELHMKCVARSLCEQCHLCFTADRATIQFFNVCFHQCVFLS